MGVVPHVKLLEITPGVNCLSKVFLIFFFSFFKHLLWFHECQFDDCFANCSVSKGQKDNCKVSKTEIGSILHKTIIT